MTQSIALPYQLTPVAAAGREGAVFIGSRSGFSFPTSRIVLLALVFVTAVYSGIVQRHALVRAVPGLAAAFNAAGLPVNIYQAEFRNVRAILERDDREARLTVEGAIGNLSKSENIVPDIQIALVNESGQTSFAWIARLPENRLSALGSLSFRATLDSPPRGQYHVVLKFAR